jgi:hypothetical protein
MDGTRKGTPMPFMTDPRNNVSEVWSSTSFPGSCIADNHLSPVPRTDQDKFHEDIEKISVFT